MCKHSIRLKNPSKFFDPGRDKLDISVPCGHCSDCDNKKRFDWQVRVYYEYLDTIDKGGFVLFMTMTHNDASLPFAKAKVRDYLRDENGFALLDDDGKPSFKEVESEMSCFDKVELQNFTKRVRSDIRRSGKDVSYKYFISSEYGHEDTYVDRHGVERKGTGRPHYHGLHFFIGDITPSEARNILRDAWRHFSVGIIDWQDGQPIHNYKDNGVVDFTDQPGAVTMEHGLVTGPGAIGYVCKYVQKSQDNAEALRKHLHMDENSWLMEDKRRFNRNFLPFHIQSQGLGKCIIDRTPEDLLAKGKTKYPMYDETKKNVTMQVVDLPLYVERKHFCYDQKSTPNRSYIYTAEGKLMRANRLAEHRCKLIEKVNDFILNIDNYVTPKLLRYINEELHRTPGEKGYYLRAIDFARDIRDNIGCYNTTNLVDYILLFDSLLQFDSTKNGHYVSSYVDELLDIDRARFVSIVRDLLKPDRTKSFEPRSNISLYQSLKKHLLYIPELANAWRLYSSYLSVLNKFGEEAIQESLRYQNRMRVLYFKVS